MTIRISLPFHPARVFFYCCGPFLLVPRVIGFWKIFCCRPRVCKVFFFCCAPLGAATFRRGQSKKKTPPRVFFFGSGPGERQGKEKPRWAPARGQSKKKTPLREFFFCCGPGERQGKEKPRWKPARGQSKKKHHPGCFFLLRPRGKAGEGEAPLGAGTGPEQKVFFFALAPVPAPNGASPSLAFPRGRSKKKKTPWVVFFFALAPCRRPTGLLLPLAFRRGRSKKKKTPWVVFFFFLLRPRADAHSLTAGLGGDASPSPGWCDFFLLRPRPDRGGVFFFAVAPPGRSLTHGGAISARPGWCFFSCCGPAGSFLDNNKKMSGVLHRV